MKQCNLPMSAHSTNAAGNSFGSEIVELLLQWIPTISDIHLIRFTAENKVSHCIQLLIDLSLRGSPSRRVQGRNHGMTARNRNGR